MGEPTLEDARRRFFAQSGFAPDGGYDDGWAHAAFGPVPYSVPNPRMRAEALRVHDLHHPLTGYPADWRGEAKISAWELGSGGAGRYPYAWFIALFGLVTGLLGLPRATWRAFVAGRSATNLYRDEQPMRWLSRPVSEARGALGIERDADRRTAPQTGDRLAFFGWSALASSLAVVFALGVPLLLLAALAHRMGRTASCLLRCPLRAAGVS